MPYVRSASFNFCPRGRRTTQTDRLGLAALVCDLMTRGAGERDSRQLPMPDNLGVDRAKAPALNVHASGATLANLLPRWRLRDIRAGRTFRR